MKMSIPDYSGNNCYKTVSSFAQRMGLEVIYRDDRLFPDNALAYADVYDSEDGQHKCIVMPHNEDRIISYGKDPAAVLAHEITHYLIEDFFNADAIINKENCFPLRLMLENDCDRMGLAIYLLAEAIASHEATI